MKRNRLFALVLVLLMLTAAITGCGGSSNAANENAMYESEAAGGTRSPSLESDMSGLAEDTLASIQSTDLPADAKLIYTGDLTIQTTDLDAAAQGLIELVNRYGGYIESQEIYRQSSYKSAGYTVRVPGEQFAAFISSVSESDVFTVTYQNTSTQNVGEQYADIENRLETLNIKLDRLQDLLARAESMEDIITIESSISDVEYEIELYSGEKNHYDSLISYSTVYITVDEVRITGEGVDPSLGQRLSSGFQRGLGNFVDGCEDFLVWIVSHLIGVIVFLAIAAGVIVVLRRRNRRMRKEREEQRQQKETK